ncbi:Alpha/Beta hydrolase protein [Infundibulicybe gibba]|nr:Alpha/Beta hydrolase protein [Infundibulicybe gibba]
MSEANIHLSTLNPGAEKYLQLPNGRTLAYSENGDASSPIVVMFLHGLFGVGDASRYSRVLKEKNVHLINPTLPGWGNSSPIPAGTSYHIGIASDIAALIDHLYPNATDLRLYIGGGSYGTVPAQMLYGAPFDIFPPGRHLCGCLLMAPFTPFRHHKGYAKALSSASYFSVGPPARYIPFRLIQRLASYGLGARLKTDAQAEEFIRGNLFAKMGEHELAAFQKWKREEGVADDEIEKKMAGDVLKSTCKTWDGFMEVADVIHSDWGFKPDELDVEHNARPLLVVTSTGDTMAPEGMAKWIAETYKNTKLMTVEGGHLAGLFHLTEIWAELLAREPYDATPHTRDSVNLRLYQRTGLPLASVNEKDVG